MIARCLLGLTLRVILRPPVGTVDATCRPLVQQTTAVAIVLSVQARGTLTQSSQQIERSEGRGGQIGAPAPTGLPHQISSVATEIQGNQFSLELENDPGRLDLGDPDIVETGSLCDPAVFDDGLGTLV